ncbi:MAG: hypothetical protein ACR2MY_14155 [Candidatus Dormibacteria bacterium]
MTPTAEAFPRVRLAASYAVFFTGLGLLMALRLHGVSAAAYSNMAVAFLHGRLDVAPDVHDVAVFGGRGYYPLGPAPAALVLPLVAAFGAGVPNLFVGLPRSPPPYGGW